MREAGMLQEGERKKGNAHKVADGVMVVHDMFAWASPGIGGMRDDGRRVGDRSIRIGVGVGGSSKRDCVREQKEFHVVDEGDIRRSR